MGRFETILEALESFEFNVESLNNRLEMLQTKLDGPSAAPMPLASGLMMVSEIWKHVAVVSAARGKQEGWALIAEWWRHSALYQFARFRELESRRDRWLADRSEPMNHRLLTMQDLSDVAFAWCFAVTIGQVRCARLLGNDALAVLNKCEPEDGLLKTNSWYGSELPLWAFRLHALWTKQPWKFSGPMPKDWDAFDAVFRTWDDAPAFDRAVMTLCEYHITHDDPDIGVAPFSDAVYRLFPVEILALKAIRADLKLPFPAVEHPLIQGNPLCDFPRPMPVFETNELFDKVMAKIHERTPDFQPPWDVSPDAPRVPRPIPPKKSSKKTSSQKAKSASPSKTRGPKGAASKKGSPKRGKK